MAATLAENVVEEIPMPFPEMVLKWFKRTIKIPNVIMDWKAWSLEMGKMKGVHNKRMNPGLRGRI